jgi:hypothetical protein
MRGSISLLEHHGIRDIYIIWQQCMIDQEKEMSIGDEGLSRH